MSDAGAVDQGLVCDNCGTRNIPGARFCAQCGMRLTDGGPVEPSAAAFDATVAEVLEQDTTPQISSAEDRETPQSTWTASGADWSAAGTTGQPASEIGPAPGASLGTTALTSEPAKKSNTTLWIILGIVGFILFCCCVLMITLIVVSAKDTAFQEQVSSLALR